MTAAQGEDMENGVNCVWCGQAKDKHGPPGQSPLGKPGDCLCPGTSSQFFTLPKVTLPLPELVNYYLHEFPVKGDMLTLWDIAEDAKQLSRALKDQWFARSVAEQLAIGAQERLAKFQSFSGKTADGQPYGRSSKVYYVDPVGYVQGLDVGLRFQTDSSVPSEVYRPYPVYSTREAAEAASKAKAATDGGQ